MAIDYVMPKLAMAMNEGTVNQWLVDDGQYVEKGQNLATVSLVYRLDVNEFRGEVNPQLVVEKIIGWNARQ